MIAAYVRVSTHRQKDDSQRHEIQRWLNANGIDPELVEWYSDTISGKSMVRPEFQRLQRDIFSGKVKQVILWKLDRLSRRLKDGIVTLADWAEKDVKIVVVTQQIEFSGAIGKTLAALLLGLAEIELEFRRERQAAGIAVARKKGGYQGRKPGTKKAKPNRVQELRNRGLTVLEISTALGLSERSVYRYLSEAAKQP